MKLLLHPLSPELLDRLCDDPAGALQGIATIAPESLDWLKEVAAMTLAHYHRTGAQPPWIGYLAIDQDAGEVVGTCGFKGNPNAAREVEIAYGTIKSFEGRGVATAMARQLTAVALRKPAARFVIAHTLPERNASGRVLEKSGYQLAGEVIDPEDGTVWRWELQNP